MVCTLPSRWASLLASLGWLLGGLACPPVHAIEERELKAAIVFNLLIFVEWPAEAGAPVRDSLVLCVAPASVLNAPLKALHGRAVRSQRLDVREMAPGSSWASCQAVYVDASGPARAATAPKSAGWADTLVICDDLPEPPLWAAIVLRRMGSRIGFDVNLEAVRQTRLQLSSKLLRLAREVKE
jgi:hypothetical protein